jgi:hypothetical protein
VLQKRCTVQVLRVLGLRCRRYLRRRRHHQQQLLEPLVPLASLVSSVPPMRLLVQLPRSPLQPEVLLLRRHKSRHLVLLRRRKSRHLVLLAGLPLLHLQRVGVQ